MLAQLLVTLVVALGMAPCVLQRACPARPPHPPSSVCLHRIPHNNRRVCDARAGICGRGTVRARVVLPTVLRVSLAAVLLLLSLRLPQGLMDTALPLLLALIALQQVAGDCKNCVSLGKEEKAMFRAHSEACLSESHVDPKLLESMLRGQLVDDPALRKHVYCVLLKCKVIGKDGKMQKAAVLGKLAARSDGRNVTKVLESCADQRGDNPEDLAWNLFRCGYDKKAVLFDYMPIATDNDSTS